jgi:hypothetical protein
MDLTTPDSSTTTTVTATDVAAALAIAAEIIVSAHATEIVGLIGAVVGSSVMGTSLSVLNR